MNRGDWQLLLVCSSFMLFQQIFWNSSQNINKFVFRWKHIFFCNSSVKDAEPKISAVRSSTHWNKCAWSVAREADRLPHYDRKWHHLVQMICGFWETNWDRYWCHERGVSSLSVMHYWPALFPSVCLPALFFCVGTTGLSTLSPAGSGRGKDRGKSRKSIFGTAPARCNATGEVTTQSRTPGKGTPGLGVLTVVGLSEIRAAKYRKNIFRWVQLSKTGITF